jgi:hypothetical protein
MMSLGTDFEMHAIWQGYVEDPAAKDFCSKEGPHYRFEQSAKNPTINLIHEFGFPWGFLTQAVLHSLAGLMSRKKVSVRGFL